MKKGSNIINNNLFGFGFGQGIGIKIKVIKVICLIFLLGGFGIAEDNLGEAEKVGVVVNE